MSKVKHAFTSAKSDGGDATLVRPSNWNADHVGLASADLVATEGQRIGKGAGSTFANTGSTSDATQTIGSWWNNASDDYAGASLFTFDVSSLAGLSVHSAYLELTVTDWSNIFNAANGSSYLRFVTSEIARAYNLLQATYDVYTTGNSWTSAGAMSAGSDRYASFGTSSIFIFAPTPSATDDGAVKIDVGLLLRNALAASRTTFRTITGLSGQASSQNKCTVAGVGNATVHYRPTLRVLYDIPAP